MSERTLVSPKILKELMYLDLSGWQILRAYFARLDGIGLRPLKLRIRQEIVISLNYQSLSAVASQAGMPPLVIEGRLYLYNEALGIAFNLEAFSADLPPGRVLSETDFEGFLRDGALPFVW